MKLFATYQNLKKKSMLLLDQGYVDEYVQILVKLSEMEKTLKQLSFLN